LTDNLDAALLPQVEVGLVTVLAVELDAIGRLWMSAAILADRVNHLLDSLVVGSVIADDGLGVRGDVTRLLAYGS
jgi:hypothetical protein